MFLNSTRETHNWAGEVVGGDLEDDRSVKAGSLSTNKSRFLADRGKEEVIEQVVVVGAANASTSYQLGNFVKQVPLSLLP
jgi:hypothetical protein